MTVKPPFTEYTKPYLSQKKFYPKYGGGLLLYIYNCNRANSRLVEGFPPYGKLFDNTA